MSNKLTRSEATKYVAAARRRVDHKRAARYAMLNYRDALDALRRYMNGEGTIDHKQALRTRDEAALDFIRNHAWLEDEKEGK